MKNGSPTKSGRKLKKASTSVSEPDLSVGGGRARSPAAAKKRTKPPSTASSSESGAVAASPTKTNGAQKRSRSQGKPSVADSSSGGGDATSGDINGGKKTATSSPRKTAGRGSSDAIFSDEETDYTRLGMSSRRKTYLDVLALERDRRERKKKSGAAAESVEDGGGENTAVLFDRNGRRIRKVVNARRFSYFVGLAFFSEN